MNTAGFSIEFAGDAAVIVAFAATGVDLSVQARVAHTAAVVGHQAIAGVRDVVPTLHSLAVYYDPLRVDLDRLVAVLTAAAGDVVDAAALPVVVHDIPVWYGGSAGPDLETVAEAARLSAASVIALHSGTVYRVFMMGFTPGFAYLGPVDARIAVPRRATPRLRVPAGSVGIAGVQTGVYPSETPGGWMIVGRTPVRTFVPGLADPFLVKPGDGVRFQPISEAEYRRLERHRAAVERNRAEEGRH